MVFLFKIIVYIIVCDNYYAMINDMDTHIDNRKMCDIFIHIFV